MLPRAVPFVSACALLLAKVSKNPNPSKFTISFAWYLCSRFFKSLLNLRA